MKLILSAIVSLLATMNLAAQCNTFFPMRENVKVYYDHFDKKEKLVLRTMQKITKVSGSGASMKATLAQDLIDVKKNETMVTSESELDCEAGVLRFSMSSMAFMDPSQGAMNAQGMSMEVTGDQMDLPSTLRVGETLKDVNYQMKMSMNGMSLMNRKYTVTNRKVESEEEVVTPAGAFHCYKITFTTTSQGGMGGGTMKSSMWYAQDTGLVKSETFSDNGKLLGRQVLTKIEK